MKFTIALLSLCLMATGLCSQTLDPAQLSQLEYRFIGPDGNRAIAVAGIPGDPHTMFVGAASGGLWKTTDGGTSWNAVFDDHEVSSVSALAVAPTDRNIMWMGTGETFLIRPAHSIGNGIYRSDDGGETWTNMGLEKTARIGRIVIHPQNPDIVYAAALGHAYGPQQERGVYRTKDGGKSWEKVLFVDENTGAADIAINPENPDVLFAGMWQIHINTWGLNSGGPGSDVYRSLDGGDTWVPMKDKGLPKEGVGKTAVAIAPGNTNIVYALLEGHSPWLYRSEDNGETWELRSRNHTMAERAPYYTRLGVSPEDENRVYFISVRFSMSLDGGKTLVEKPPRGGGDTHDIWIDPTNAAFYMVADDAGATVTYNEGKTFRRIVLPIAQMYHVAVDNEIPYNVYGNRQDGYSYRGPSNSRQRGFPLGLWRDVGGCESGFATPDPTDANIVWSGCYDGGLQRIDLRTGHVRDVRVWPEASYGWPPAEVRQRWHWNFPLHISPHDHETVYVGSQVLHRSNNGGQSWEPISPDLTLNLKDHQQSSGGVAFDNLMTYDGALLFAIAESPVEKGVIWVGSNDGQVQLTKDGGATWSNLTANIPELPSWGTIANIEASKHAAGKAYISVDLHQMGNFDPFIYRTLDYGQTWTRINEGIPHSYLSFVHVIKEDPKKEGVLFAGTDNSVYWSPNDGETWTDIRNNMPPAPMYWLTIQEEFDDLVIATYGRGFYILDDLSPFRELAALDANKSAELFPVRKAYRFRPINGIKGEAGSHVGGTNPPYGASINYYLKDSLSTPPKVQILDGSGTLVREMEGPNKAGVNRLWWNLRTEETIEPRLRTTPPGKEWVTFNDEGWRELYTWDLDLFRGQWGQLVMPGQYQVKLMIGEDTFEQSLEVLRDPHTTGTDEEIQQQYEFTYQLYQDINSVASMINQLEWLKRDVIELLKVNDSKKLKKRLDQYYAELLETESKLYDVNLTGAREDAFRNPMKLYGRLSALASDAGYFSADFRPTDQQREVYAVLKERLEKATGEYEVLVGDRFIEVNNALQSLGTSLELKK